MHIYGIPVFFTPMALEKTNVPSKEHPRKNWMSDSYHARIQKKWVKRYGFVMKPAIYQTQKGFFAHPSFEYQLRKVAGR